MMVWELEIITEITSAQSNFSQFNLDLLGKRGGGDTHMHISIIFFSFGDFHDFNVYYWPVFSKLDNDCEHDHELVTYNCILYHCKIIHYGDFGWGSAESKYVGFYVGGGGGGGTGFAGIERGVIFLLQSYSVQPLRQRRNEQSRSKQNKTKQMEYNA